MKIVLSNAEATSHLRSHFSQTLGIVAEVTIEQTPVDSRHDMGSVTRAVRAIHETKRSNDYNYLIPAVKKTREILNCGLVEAKHFVEAVFNR